MKVLIGVDGSVESRRAVELVGDVLNAERDDVVLYYAPPLNMLGDIDDSRGEKLAAARQALADVVLASAKTYLPGPLRYKAQTLVGTRKPRKGILLAAAHTRPDMIAVGATGASNIARMLLGSVSRTVVQDARVPVLLARDGNHTAKPLRVLLTYDREGTSSEAFRFGEQLTWPAEAVGYAVHVRESVFHGPIPSWLMQEVPQVHTELLSKAWIEEEQREAEAAKQGLKALCQRMPRPFCDVEPAFLEGNAGEEIVKYINANEIDLVILGARVQSAVGRMLAGSTSHYVLAQARCSVLIVPHYDIP
jgi:nucleotide-binding universal stress UspA family protein